jgi:hypothetical protein
MDVLQKEELRILPIKKWLSLALTLATFLGRHIVKGGRNS